MAAKFSSLDRRRLRLLLGVLFLALALPTAVLIHHALLQLKWESLHQHQVLAEELSARIDARLRRLIDAEEERSFADYAFLVLVGDEEANFVQRSPLSQFPPKSAIPGLVGYFQIDADGGFTTPLLPTQAEEAALYGISIQEFKQRLAAQERVLDVLGRNRLARERPKPATPTEARQDAKQTEALQDKDAGPVQAAAVAPLAAAPRAISQTPFDELSEEAAPKQEKLAKQPIAPKRANESMPGLLGSFAEKMSQRSMRKEKSALPEPALQAPKAKLALPPPVRVATFESEIDPFEFNRLETGHFVLFRKVWREDKRYIQGLVVEPAPFLSGIIGAEFAATALSRMGGLRIVYRGETLAAFDTARSGYLNEAGELRGDGLYRTRLSAPLSEVELLFTLTNLPAGPGGVVVVWLAGILAIVLCGGFVLLYRLGLKLITLARQQQDFVAAVSHELKTPLTSIRMYGEMLREGWVTEEKKTAYYEFICSESERLSRLIANVLQLSRMTRNTLEIVPRPMAARALIEEVQAKVKSQVERAGFALHLQGAEDALSSVVMADADGFAQIMINLIDNALKFSAKAPQKQVDIGCSRQRGKVVFCVRDYGAGVPKNQMKHIFKLFYRLENELTRETVGTGIGLALVRQLAAAMGAEVELCNRHPGAEFQVLFPAADSKQP
jgi:signal transduction histidine kinase